MNAPLRRAGVVVIVLFALLFLNLNWVQAYKADDYRNSDYNSRVQISEYQRQRGNIEAGGGTVILAQSKETEDELKYLRTYPVAAQYAHIVGYKPVNGAATGIEKLENDFLSGNADSQIADRWLAMLTGKRAAGGNVVLTVSPAGQKTAYEQLERFRPRRGAVVAVDPSNGAVLAAVSTPSFDASPLANHDTEAAQAAYDRLEKDQAKPLLNRAWAETFAPGSTFKVVVSAAALRDGVRPEQTLTGGTQYKLPETTRPIVNAPGVNCPEQISLKQALTVSCNTAFSRLGVEQLGADKVKSMAQAFGFEEAPRFDRDQKNVMGVAASNTGDMLGPDGQVDKPVLAQSCIGQSSVRMTPLQGALIAATVANGGTLMRPYLVDRELGSDRSSNYVAQPKRIRQPIDSGAAADLRDMMVSVVQSGTGTAAKISGVEVGGKTGTAEEQGDQDHGWFIGFAIKDGKPVAAVAVVLENFGRNGSATAAGLGGQVMRAIIQERGSK